ncbi:hypothetical protein BD626DRAFT_472398 [Schizophyllum amplum]|uniref:Uncharacterized protein n=1 Tax=Schizophyllum amplum TaxID=97359 RepID=A0A550CVW1_9AGAR|nr:hypothetical protein BD626DRAFT_472398 [Auriculariopsis ampla]
MTERQKPISHDMPPPPLPVRSPARSKPATRTHASRTAATHMPRNNSSFSTDASGYDLSAFGDISLTKPYCLPGCEVDWDERPARVGERYSRPAPSYRAHHRNNSRAPNARGSNPSSSSVIPSTPAKDPIPAQRQPRTPLSPHGEFQMMVDTLKHSRQYSNAPHVDLLFSTTTKGPTRSVANQATQSTSKPATRRSTGSVTSHARTATSRARTIRRADPSTARVRPEQIHNPKTTYDTDNGQEDGDVNEGAHGEARPDEVHPNEDAHADEGLLAEDIDDNALAYQSSEKALKIQRWVEMVEEEREREKAAENLADAKEKLKLRAQGCVPVKFASPKKVRAPVALARERPAYDEMVHRVRRDEMARRVGRDEGVRRGRERVEYV